MDTSRYRAFVQASDQGSLSKAAKTLNYTPSGVSQLITALERDLGFSVLERNPHGVQPTSEGSRILPAARAVIQEEERLLQVSSEIKRPGDRPSDDRVLPKCCRPLATGRH